MAPKARAQDYMFKLQEGQLLLKLPGQLNGAGFRLDRLKGCEVYLLDWTSQVFVDDCVDCRIFIGPCSGSVFMRDCTRCTLCVASRQLRTRDCRDLHISLYCSTNPSIETSTACRFSPWRGAYPHARAQFAAAQLDPATNTWDQVYDFNAGEEVQGHTQHWELDTTPRPLWVPPLCVAGHTLLPGEPENPVLGSTPDALDGQEAVGLLPCPHLEQLVQHTAGAAAGSANTTGPAATPVLATQPMSAAALAAPAAAAALHAGGASSFAAAAPAPAAGGGGGGDGAASGSPGTGVDRSSHSSSRQDGVTAPPLVSPLPRTPAAAAQHYDLEVDVESEEEGEAEPQGGGGAALAGDGGASTRTALAGTIGGDTAPAAAAHLAAVGSSGGSAPGPVVSALLREVAPAAGTSGAAAAGAAGAAAAGRRSSSGVAGNRAEDARYVWRRANAARLAEAQAAEVVAKEAARAAAQTTLRIKAQAREALIAAHHASSALRAAAPPDAGGAEQLEAAWPLTHPHGWQGVCQLIPSARPQPAAGAMPPGPSLLQVPAAASPAQSACSLAGSSAGQAPAPVAPAPVHHGDTSRMRQVLLGLRAAGAD